MFYIIHINIFRNSANRKQKLVTTAIHFLVRQIDHYFHIRQFKQVEEDGRENTRASSICYLNGN